MLRYEREIEELLEELEWRERCAGRALPPNASSPHEEQPELRRLSTIRQVVLGPGLFPGLFVGVMLLLVGAALGGAFGQWAVLVGVVVLAIKVTTFLASRPAYRVVDVPMDIDVYRVPPRWY